MEVNTCIEDLERRIGRMAKNMGQSSICDHANTETEPPFSTWITRFTILRKFKQPHLESYNGSRSPMDHVRTYKAQMGLATNADELYCLAFPNTLKGLVAQWFHSLKPHRSTISNRLASNLSASLLAWSIGQNPTPNFLPSGSGKESD